MGIWILLAIAIVLLLWRSREHYVEISGPGVRPSKTADWLSKIDAEAPIGANDEDYLLALGDFYDKVYKPARTANATVFIPDTTVEQFVNTPYPGVDKNALRRIIVAGFAVMRTGTAAAREKKETVTTGALAGFKGENLQPSEGVDEVRTRVEEEYRPEDTREGNLPEGLYAPTEQQESPRREGEHDDKSTSWTGAKFYSIE